MGEPKVSSGSSWGMQVIQRERDKRGNMCEVCGDLGGIPTTLQFHHIKPTALNGRGRGLNRRAKDIRDNPDCYILLCPACHHKEHADNEAEDNY